MDIAPDCINNSNDTNNPQVVTFQKNTLYLTDAQRSLLAPTGGNHPRDGTMVPGSDQPPFVQADAWCWALCGEYIPRDAAYSAVTIYNSDEGAFVFDVDRVPVGLNPAFFDTLDMNFPQTLPYHITLAGNLANALAGYEEAQDACRLALMQLTAMLNGHTVLPADGSPVYTLVMKSDSWYTWDHWAVGIQGLAPGAPTTYQQKVNGSPLQYDCGVVWDEQVPLQTVIRIDGLLQPQVTMLNNVV